MIIPASQIEIVIQDAIQAAKSSGKKQFVQAMNWDELYGSLGFTDDPEFHIGKLHAIVEPDGSVQRLWKKG
jgi:hypothetical protein